LKKFRHTKFYQVLFWSVISAAFIGPGTVTTALKSGALFQLELLWAILFSILGCYVLQESASRITIVTGLDLPEIFQSRFERKGILNIHYLLIISIIFGCMAYQAGNMTGAVVGLGLITQVPESWILFFLYVVAFLILWKGHIHTISHFMGILIGLMALIFVLLSVRADFKMKEIVDHLLIPHLPNHSAIYVIALVGTTIVPYNLFLGSGISRGQQLASMRFGLGSAILIGGIITATILISGTFLSTDFSFNGVYILLVNRLGNWVGRGFALGLFAAGLSSSITAPLAAAITAKSVINKLSRNNIEEKRYFRITWIIVLSIGAVFTLLDDQPVILIVAAQAINGLILPFVAFYLYVLINDRSILPGNFRNISWYNFLMLLVTAISIFLGLYHFLGVIIHYFLEKPFLIPQTAVSLLITAVLILRLFIITSRESGT
jgi:manganese transport protein